MKKRISKNHLSEWLLKVDLFGEKAELQIEGKSSYQSFYGALISLGILGTVLAYGHKKFQTMTEYNDTTFKEVV